jgi:hypothetical protein
MFSFKAVASHSYIRIPAFSPATGAFPKVIILHVL